MEDFEVINDDVSEIESLSSIQFQSPNTQDSPEEDEQDEDPCDDSPEEDERMMIESAEYQCEILKCSLVP